MIHRHGLKVVLAIELAILAITGWQTIVRSGNLDADFLWIVPPLAFTIVGGLVAWKRPDNLIGWLFLLPVGFMSLLVFGELAEVPRIQTALGSWVIALQALSSLGWTGLLGTMLTLTWLYFPDGRLPAARWRPLMWMTVLAILLAALSDLEYDPPPNANVAALAMIGNLSILLLLGSVLGSFASLYHRYRRGRETQRQQIRWIVSAAAVTVLILLPNILWEYVSTPSEIGSIMDVLLPASVSLVPVAAGIAILRHRLFDIDLIIRRTLIYTVLTGLLVVAFFGSVTLINTLLNAITGPRSQIVTVLSTLAIAALFAPLRRRVQAGIDRRFYRRHYVAEHAFAGFSASLRQETDLDVLGDRLIYLIEETIQPSSISLWMRDKN